jgi:hypothetical protein
VRPDERDLRSGEGGVQVRAAVGYGRLADLLAYRTMVQQVRPWPFDTPALMRMLLSLVIPLAAWIASAVAQHVLGHYLLSG